MSPDREPATPKEPAQGAFARACRWLRVNGWIVGGGHRKDWGLSVFETFTWKTATTITLAMAAFCGIETLVLGTKGNSVVLGTCGVIAIWLFTLAAFGKGRAEHSTWEVTRACVVAAVVSVIGLLLAYVAIDLATGELSPKLGSALAVGTVAMTMMVFFIAREHAIKRQELAEARERLAAERAEREASARALAEAQLNVLQAQIEPHFLFNALSNLQSLIAEDPAAAQRMTAALTRYLRQAMPQNRGTATTFGRQLELTRSYLDIMRMRMGERLRYRIRAEEDVLSAPFPPLVMATLVENAVKHGLEPKPGGGFIDIAARREDGRLVVEVCDDGVGFSPDAEGGHGVGLANTRARLTALYGERAALEIAPNVPSGVMVSVTLPLEPGDAHRPDR